MANDLKSNQPTSLTNNVSGAAKTVGGTLAFLWVVAIIDWILGGMIGSMAIHPRTMAGLFGMLIAPITHVGLAHLTANSIGLVLLAPLTMLRRRSDFWAVTAGTALSSGLCAWLLGAANSNHLGASGVIFGYLGFLMGRGIFERSLGAIALSVAVTWAFGSMVWGVFPLINPGVSWQGHLGGFVGGLLMARALGGSKKAS